jgi:HlyD family secretion protein
MNDTSENGKIIKVKEAGHQWWKSVIKIRWILLLSVIFVMTVLRLSAPLTIKAVHPQRGTLVAEAFGTGTLEAKVVVSLSAKIIGKVTEVLVDQGDTVTKGQVVARLEATDYENSVHVAEAQVKQAKAELVKASLDLKRGFSVPETAISKMQLDSYVAAYRVTEATFKSAKANLGFARARLADTVIYSPSAGLVITRNLEVGDTVVPGTPIFRIADTKQLWIAAMVDERVAGQLRLGQSAHVTFRAYPGQSFPGKLTRLSQEADRVTEEREADVTVDQLPPDWFVGAKADVYIETARQADTLQVPLTAIVRQDGKPGIFVISNGRARWQPVQIGLTGRDTVEAVNGVEAGDLVIVNPSAGKKPISDGKRVRPVVIKEQP